MKTSPVFKMLFVSLFVSVFYVGNASAKLDKELDEITRRPEIGIELKLPKNRAVRGESIPFEATLTNIGAEPYEIDEVGPTNEAMTFHLMSNKGKEIKASFMSPYLKTGGKKHKDGQIDTFLLNPKQTKTYKADVANIFGDIAPGKYNLHASYRSRNGVSVGTKTQTIWIRRAHPVYAYSYWEYDRTAESNLKTVWINKSSKYDLYYTENNPKNPEVIEVSNRVWRFSDKTRDVKISAVNDYMQSLLNLVWREGQYVYALRVEEAKAKGKPRKIRIPFKNFELLHPSFTDRDGNLFLFVALPWAKKTPVYLVKASVRGDKPEKRKIADIPGRFKKDYHFFIDPDTRMNMAVISGGRVYYFIYDIIGNRMINDVTAVEDVNDRIVDVQMLQQFQPEKGKNVSYVYYLTKLRKEKDAYTAYLIEAGTKKPKWFPKMNVYWPYRLKITQTVIDTYLRPYHLLNHVSKTFYKPYFSGDLRQILPPEKHPKWRCTFPQIIISSTLGDRYGIYVRYIKNMSQIDYKFIEEIKQ